jgi:hypothetical protein
MSSLTNIVASVAGAAADNESYSESAHAEGLSDFTSSFGKQLIKEHAPTRVVARGLNQS